MDLKPFYSYDEVARLERRSKSTIEKWLTADRQAFPDNPELRRFPGAFEGNIPLADIKARYQLTNEDIRLIDLPEPAGRRTPARASA